MLRVTVHQHLENQRFSKTGPQIIELNFGYERFYYQPKFFPKNFFIRTSLSREEGPLGLKAKHLENRVMSSAPLRSSMHNLAALVKPQLK